MTTLEQAAYDYGKAKGAVDSAISCDVPSSMVWMLVREESEAIDALCDAAEEYFNSMYDGAPD